MGDEPQLPACWVQLPWLTPGGYLADPPHIEDSGQTAELLLPAGSPMELRCDARGTPPPNITWHKDGLALSRPEDSNRVLRMEGVQVLLACCCGMRLREGRGEEKHPAALGS